jgi:hypothetical protein
VSVFVKAKKIFRRSPVNRLVELREYVQWKRRGRVGPPPAFHKRNILRSYGARFGTRTFVETGTYLGGTVKAMRGSFDRLISIELDKTLAREAQERFRGDDSIQILEGDSATLLPSVLRTLDAPTLFWLDGHYSAGITARGSLDTPLRQELDAVLTHPVPGHVVLIDDADAFGTGDYPSMEELRTIVNARRPEWTITMEDNIVRLHAPRAADD